MMKPMSGNFSQLKIKLIGDLKPLNPPSPPRVYGPVGSAIRFLVIFFQLVLKNIFVSPVRSGISRSHGRNYTVYGFPIRIETLSYIFYR